MDEMDNNEVQKKEESSKNNGTCFIIQPFNEKFNKRYKDVFEPTIRRCGFEPIRIDHEKIIYNFSDSIERAIHFSTVCFAEISTNNPNVWYEVGFAFANKKYVVMICSDEREEEYPFDVRNRKIISYKTESKSDYEKLEKEIAATLNCIKHQKSKEEKETIAEKSSKENEEKGLNNTYWEYINENNPNYEYKLYFYDNKNFLLLLKDRYSAILSGKNYEYSYPNLTLSTDCGDLEATFLDEKRDRIKIFIFEEKKEIILTKK
jgi:hypothetical protein